MMRMLLGLAMALGVLGLPGIAHADDPTPPVVIKAPAVSGPAVYRGKLVATPGTWDPATVMAGYQWLRDDKPISGATSSRRTASLSDVGHRLSVRVTVTTSEGATGKATSTAVLVSKARLAAKRLPRATGTARFTEILVAQPPLWEHKPRQVRRQWLRNGTPIRGAHGKRYRLSYRDVGKRVAVRFTAKRDGFRTSMVTSKKRRVMHRVPVRHVVRYTVATRGRITANLDTFRRLALESLRDPRGWRGAGVEFRQVRRSGSMTLVLAAPSSVPSFSSGCSSQWSCRVGRYVIINQLRWLHASPAWNRAGGTLRNYRHMVVNHETGHWLGHSHRGCPRRGALAPVMMQQSISLGGCRFNPFPTPAERALPRYR